MPTILTHTAVPLALGLGLGSNLVPRRLLLAGVAAAMAPDLDVIGFKLGIAYADSMGHRGITHSLAFAFLLGLFAAAFSSRLRAHPLVTGAFVFLVCASHGLLDMLTNGGLGIAYLWPFTNQRYFLSWHAIQVSPLTLDKVFSARGLQVLYSELQWIWLPSLLGMIALLVVRLGWRQSRPDR